MKTNSDIYEFVKYLIDSARSTHFPPGGEPKVMDYKVCGYPDVSFHGVKAWYPEFENFRRQLGVLYCGEYGENRTGPPTIFLCGLQQHWEPHEFALPHLRGTGNGTWPSTRTRGQRDLPGGGEDFEGSEALYGPPRSVVVLSEKN